MSIRWAAIPVLLASAALLMPGGAQSAPAPGSTLLLGAIRDGVYESHVTGFSVPIPRPLGTTAWVREFASGRQYEVQFGDRDCRRHYVVVKLSPVATQVQTDVAAEGSEAALSNLARQLAARRRLELVSAVASQTAKGPGLRLHTRVADAWPCVSVPPAGGRTLGSAWLFVHDRLLYEVGYQTAASDAHNSDEFAALDAEVDSFLASLLTPEETARARNWRWKPGGELPAVGGVHLGDPRSAVEQVLGKPESESTLPDTDVTLLEFRSSGLSLTASPGRGVTGMSLASREAGDLDGFRVGDRVTDVAGKWGPPTRIERGGAEMEAMLGFASLMEYRYAELSVVIRGDREGRIRQADVGLSSWDAPVAAGKILPATASPAEVQALPEDGSMAVGQVFVLPPGALGNATGDSVLQQRPPAPLVAAQLDQVRAFPPDLPGSRPAQARLAELLKAGPVTVEITCVEPLGSSPSLWTVAARVRVAGEDLARRLTAEGHVVTRKNVATDLALYALEAQARAAKRGLWGMPKSDFGGKSPEARLVQESTYSGCGEAYRSLVTQ
jgi:hypothetical protein